MRYRSKKDPGLIALAWGGIPIPFVPGILLLILPLILPGVPRGWMIGLMIIGGLILFIGIALVAFMLSLTTPMYYEITPTTLHVRGGSRHLEIALNSIQQVFPSHYPLSSPKSKINRNSPTWSLDRLQVDYRKDGRARFVLISPEDQLRFMQNLAENSEDLEVRDGRVVRR